MLTALAVFTAATARLADETDFLSAVGALKSANLRASCIPTGQCYDGSDAAKDCCVGHVIDAPISCAQGLTCTACKSAVGFVVKQLVSKGCVAIIPEGAVACEAIGLGPEDPFADICALIVAGSCPLIASQVSKGVKDPGQICEKLNYCSTSGGNGTGRVFGTECGCVAKGSCTANDDGCCSGKASRGFNHCLPLGLKLCS